MNAEILVAELQWAAWVREGRCNGILERLCVGHNGSEVLDADDDVHAFLHVEVLEILGVDGDGSLERLLEHFCGKHQYGVEEFC